MVEEHYKQVNRNLRNKRFSDLEKQILRDIIVGTAVIGLMVYMTYCSPGRDRQERESKPAKAVQSYNY